MFYGEENSKNYCVVYVLTNVWLELLQWIVFLSGNVKGPLQNGCILQRPFLSEMVGFRDNRSWMSRWSFRDRTLLSGVIHIVLAVQNDF